MNGPKALLCFPLFYRANILSMLLNQVGLLHRGVFTKGSEKCLIHEGSTIITGQGIVKAASLEAKLKIAGMFYDESIYNFITKTGRAHQVEKDSFYIHFNELSIDFSKIVPNLLGTCFSLYNDGWSKYKSCVNSGDINFDKVSNALQMIEVAKSKFNSLK